MAAILELLVVLSLAKASIAALERFQSAGDAAADPLERSAAVARAFRNNIQSVSRFLEDFENACTINCMYSEYFRFLIYYSLLHMY